MTLLRLLTGLLLGTMLSFAAAQDFVPVPPLKTRVTDQISMLAPPQRQALENVLQEYETRTGSQIAILLMSSTAPETIEQYGIRVAESWKIGRKGVDDGVILIVARDNPSGLRRLRIETGYGVEGALTDAQAGRILNDIIAPHFRQNDFYGGLVAAVSAITAVMENEELPPPQRRDAQQEEGGSWIFFLFILFIIISNIAARSRSSRNRMNRGGWGRHAPGIILGSGIGSSIGRHGRGGGFGGGFGGFGGGGGGFGGGGASGNW